MKATGIVRRIEGCVIITQSLKNRINTGVFADFVQRILRDLTAVFGSI